jgi:hypothetical protein
MNLASHPAMDDIIFEKNLALADKSTYTGFLQPTTRAFHGYGQCVFASGGKYLGGWSNGEMSGSGTLTFAADDDRGRASYEGGLQAGKFHGQGKLTYINGSFYEGGFLAGMRHGFGRYVAPDYGEYSGGYENDMSTGWGVRLRQDGARYEGGYKAGKRSGLGTQVWSNGDSYVGGWKGNKRHGVGVLKGGEDVVVSGLWTDDALLEAFPVELD